MTIRTVSSIDVSNVTDAQIGACHKCFSGSTAFYLVESATDQGKEYKVTWTREKGFQCQCKASEFGTLCWHIRASIACAKEEHEAVAELNRAIAEQARKAPETVATNVDAETLARVQVAAQTPVKASKAHTYAPKAFSLLRV